MENIIARELPGAVASLGPGIPAVVTVLCFLLIASTGFVRLYLTEQFSSVAWWLGAPLVLIGITAILGYFLGEPSLYYSFEGKSTSMAANTAFFFFLLGMSLCLFGEAPFSANAGRGRSQ